MWKKLCAAVAGLGTTVGGAQAADPDFPNKGFFAVEQLPDAAPKPARLRLLPALRAPQPVPGTPLPDPDFRGPVFRPLPGSGVVPASGNDLPLKQLPDLAPPSSAPASYPAARGPVTPVGTLQLADGTTMVPTGVSPEGETIYSPAVPHAPANPIARHPANFKVTECAESQWKVWGSAEVLLGMTRRTKVPPVITTGPVLAGFGTAGAIGQPGTAPLFGGRGMLDDWRAGLRAELGLWLDADRVWSATGRFYTLFSTSEQFTGIGNGTNVVNVPNFVPTGALTVQLPAYVGFPGITTGTVSSTAQTTFVGGDLSLRRRAYESPTARVDVLFGYRQLHLGDELGVAFRESLIGFPTALAPSLTGSDSVRSRNNFYGGNIGLVGSASEGKWSLEGLAAVSLGVNVSDVNFDQNRATALGFVTAIPLSQISTRDRTSYFSTVLESGVKLGYQITPHAKVTVGYTAMYWTNVRRAAEQYASSPILTTNTRDFYTQMISLGAEFRY